jgi:hypothetical protein
MHVKKSFTFREMQIKIIRSLFSIYLRMSNIKDYNTDVTENVEELNHSSFAGGKVKCPLIFLSPLLLL